MIEINGKPAVISSVNVRAEKHGDEFVPACDVGVTMNLESAFLSELHPDLRGLLFHKNSEAVGGDLANQAHEAPNLRFPLLGTLLYRYEGEGYTARIAQGIGAAKPIIIKDASINKVHLTPQEGGTVAVQLRIQFKPEPHVYNALCPLVQHDVELTLDPPEETK